MLRELFDLRFLLVPLAVTRTKEYQRMNNILRPSVYVGYLRVRVFGFQVAKIQETKPWD